MAGDTEVEMVTIPRTLYETLLETIEVLADKEDMESIKRGIDDIRNGNVISEEDFLKAHSDLID